MQSGSFKALLVGAIVLASATAAQAQLMPAAPGAQGNGLYVGGSLGWPHFGDAVNGVGAQDRGVAGKAFVGYSLLPNLALEAGLMNLGHVEDATSVAQRIKLYGGFTDVVGLLPLSTQFSLLGRLGYARVKANPDVGSSDTGNALKLGLGAQYNLSRNVGLRAEWERYRVDVFNSKPNVDQYTVGVTYAF